MRFGIMPIKTGSKKELFGIRLTKTRSKKERFALVLLGFVTLADAMVTILSLGFVATDWRANLLFSEWYDQFCQ